MNPRLKVMKSSDYLVRFVDALWFYIGCDYQGLMEILHVES